MTPIALVTPLVCGSILIAFGVVPGLFWGLVDGFVVELQNFRDSLRSGFPIQPPVQAESRQDRPQPIWLAGLGALVTTLTLLSYLSG
jgi:hypothetical protein